MIASLVAATALAASGLNTAPAAPAELSVMSYNVHGMPWPFAVGRPKALSEIGARLAKMRAAGDQPHLVLLQEAFTPDAKAIAREAGYRYAVTGPARDDRATDAENAEARQFLRGASMLKGEADGTIEDSGLMILSDYPVVDVKKLPYPRFACAGYDCLANKGVLMVRVSVPGAKQPVTVFDTHLNSRRQSGVSSARSDVAFAWEAQRLRAFVRENTPAASAAILAGDFNIGHRPYRAAMITGGGGVLEGGTDALRAAFAGNLQFDNRADAQAIVKHAKDWMFGRDGSTTKLILKSVSVPFGREGHGTSLSDHFGYVVHYAVTDQAEPEVARVSGAGR